MENNLLSPEFTRRPRIAKGAILLVRPNPDGTVSDSNELVVIFQYNPDVLTRIISSVNGEEASNGEGKNHGDNSIVEQISLNLEFDATDQLEHPEQHRNNIQNGLHPILAALESIIYSQSKTEDPNSPFIFFIWGPNRSIPVWINCFKITETVFDSNLNPIRARIEINMRVRELSEFKKGSPGYNICKSQLNRRQTFTQIYSAITKDKFEFP